MFCDALLECPPNKGRNPLNWKAFLSTFNKEHDVDEQPESNISKWEVVRNQVVQRPQMFTYWERKLTFDKMMFAVDDLEGIRELQETYIDKIKPLMEEMLDLRKSPFARP